MNKYTLCMTYTANRAEILSLRKKKGCFTSIIILNLIESKIIR